MANSKNEKLKRKYFRLLKGADGYSDATIDGVEKALSLYEDFAKFEDFGQFSQNKACAFKDWLLQRTYKGNPISSRTTYHVLRHVRAFFVWLSSQTGYRSKITLDSISYLNLDKRTVREVSAPKPVKFPSLDYVVKLTESIDVIAETDQRDRALIAGLLLSGMRCQAVATLPLGAFDTETLRIEQSPRLGVKTKYGKTIFSSLLRFDHKLIGYVVEWAKYLRSVKLFAETDPLFPRCKIVQAEDGFTFESHEVEPVFWESTGPIRTILETRAAHAGLEYYHPHSFRHAAVHQATRYVQTPEEMKALSQNFGHEHVNTTLQTYGTLEVERVNEIIDSIDFSAQEDKSDEVAINQTLLKLNRLMKKRRK